MAQALRPDQLLYPEARYLLPMTLITHYLQLYYLVPPTCYLLLFLLYVFAVLLDKIIILLKSMSVCNEKMP